VLRDGATLRPLFREVGFAIPALAARAGVRDMTDFDPYLLRHLARRLARHLLAALMEAFGTGGPLDAGAGMAPPLHVGLDLATLLSAEFGAFARRCRDAACPLGVLVELAEACADPAAFEWARARAAELGCLLVLDGVSHLALLLTRPWTLRADLLRLNWSPLLEGLAPAEQAELAAAVQAAGASRLVLIHADTEAAVRWGMAHGIRRFQGQHVEAMLAAARLLFCPSAADCTLAQCVARASASGRSGRRFCRRPDLLDAAGPVPAGGVQLLGAAELSARVRSCLAGAVARQALVLHLSRLPPAFTRPHHLRLARAALDPLREADRAEAFALANGDAAVLWRGDAAPALQRCLHAIAELFAEAGPAAPGTGGLCRLLELPRQAELLLQIARDSEAAADAPAEPALLPPPDLAALGALEAALERVDVAAFSRRRPVCTPAPDGSFRLCWDHRSIAVEQVAAVLAPGCAAAADPWLFHRLTRTLDRRMLALLAAPGELQAAGPFGIDLNVASILGPAFLHFDAALPAALRGHVTLGLRAADIVGDLPGFLFARAFAAVRGYRLLLRNVGVELLAALPLARLGLDLLQLRWSPALAEADPEELGADPGQIVLAHADATAAIAWGRLRGIGLFQGRAAMPTAVREPPRYRGWKRLPRHV
jgi:hypothetical protein